MKGVTSKAAAGSSHSRILFWLRLVQEVLVKWRELGYEHSSWERAATLQTVEGAPAAIAKLQALQPIASQAPELMKVQRLLSGLLQLLALWPTMLLGPKPGQGWPLVGDFMQIEEASQSHGEPG